jgi:hypothetical protein
MPSRDVWEENYTDFDACDSMPAKQTKEYTWRQTQLSSGSFGLDAKNKKEIEANEGGTMESKTGWLHCNQNDCLNYDSTTNNC